MHIDPQVHINASLVFPFFAFYLFPTLKVTNPISTCCNPIGAMKLHKVSKSGHLIRAKMSRVTFISPRSTPIWIIDLSLLHDKRVVLLVW